jgi:hypothetical protein
LVLYSRIHGYRLCVRYRLVVDTLRARARRVPFKSGVHARAVY